MNLHHAGIILVVVGFITASLSLSNDGALVAGAVMLTGWIGGGSLLLIVFVVRCVAKTKQ